MMRADAPDFKGGPESSTQEAKSGGKNEDSQVEEMNDATDTVQDPAEEEGEEEELEDDRPVAENYDDGRQLGWDFRDEYNSSEVRDVE